jgi:hypothetical protein
VNGDGVADFSVIVHVADGHQIAANGFISDRGGGSRRRASRAGAAIDRPDRRHRPKTGAGEGNLYDEREAGAGQAPAARIVSESESEVAGPNQEWAKPASVVSAPPSSAPPARNLRISGRFQARRDRSSVWAQSRAGSLLIDLGLSGEIAVKVHQPMLSMSGGPPGSRPGRRPDFARSRRPRSASPWPPPPSRLARRRRLGDSSRPRREI